MDEKQKLELQQITKKYYEESAVLHFKENRTLLCYDHVLAVFLNEAMLADEPDATAFVRAARLLARIIYGTAPYKIYKELDSKLSQILGEVSFE